MTRECRTITVDEAAEILGLGRCSAYAGVANGEIPHIRIGKRILVPIDQLEQMLAGKNVDSWEEPKWPQKPQKPDHTE